MQCVKGAILWNYQHFKIMQGDCDDDADDIDDHHVDDVDEHDHAGDWKDTGGGLGALLGHLRTYFVKYRQSWDKKI